MIPLAVPNFAVDNHPINPRAHACHNQSDSQARSRPKPCCGKYGNSHEEVFSTEESTEAVDNASFFRAGRIRERERRDESLFRVENVVEAEA